MSLVLDSKEDYQKPFLGYLCGDLDILVGDGDEAMTIRVISKVLKYHSEVFKTMLGPNFAEGATIQSSAHPVLHLPEDNPKAFLEFSNLIHHPIQESFELNLKILPDLVVLCDKYLCIKVLRLPMRRVLNWIVEEKGAKNCSQLRDLFNTMPISSVDLMIIVYFIHEQSWFQYILTFVLVEYDASELKDRVDKGLRPFLTDTMLEAFKRTQSEWKFKIIEQLNNTPKSIISSHRQNSTVSSQRASKLCPNSRLLISQFYNQLTHHHLRLSLDAKYYTRTSLPKILLRVKAMHEDKLLKVECNKNCQYRQKSRMKQKIARIVIPNQDILKWLCVTCLKEGKVPDGECEAQKCNKRTPIKTDIALNEILKSWTIDHTTAAKLRQSQTCQMQ